MDKQLGQHEFIDTTAKWGRDFVEVINPLEENSIMRFYFELPQREYPDNFIDALKFHTAMQELEPEPVAWIYRGNLHEFDPSDWAEGEVTPLYTAPPQREWVGLTAQDLSDVGAENIIGAIWADAKLKEKNHG